MKVFYNKSFISKSIVLSFFLFYLNFFAGFSLADQKKDELIINRYNSAIKKVNNKNYNGAKTAFTYVHLINPFSKLGEDALLMEIYCLYKDRKFLFALDSISQFCELYTKNLDNYIYVKYMEILCCMNYLTKPAYCIDKIDCAKNLIMNFISCYPTSKYVNHLVSNCLPLVKEQVLSKEMYVGRFYLKTDNPAGAILRFKNVLRDDSEDNIFLHEAAYRILEAYFSLALYSEVLDYYLQNKKIISKSDFWNKKAQKILDKCKKLV